jgi:peptidyl-tRNA hydrolase
MDLKLSLGKMAASVATAALGAFKQIEAKSAKD